MALKTKSENKNDGQGSKSDKLEIGSFEIGFLHKKEDGSWELRDNTPEIIAQKELRRLIDMSIDFLRWVAARQTWADDFRPWELPQEMMSSWAEGLALDIPEPGPSGARFAWRVSLEPNPEGNGQPGTVSGPEPDDGAVGLDNEGVTMGADPFPIELRWRTEKKRSKGVAAGMVDVPQILYELANVFGKWRPGPDIAYWYYRNVEDVSGLAPGPSFQRDVRVFIRGLDELKGEESATPSSAAHMRELFQTALGQRLGPAVERGRVAEAKPAGSEGWSWLFSGGKGEASDPRWRALAGLLEVSHGLGMVRWTSAGEREAHLSVVHVPQPNVLAAKIFGFKSSVVGFDDLFGGGLNLTPTLSRERPEARRRRPGRRPGESRERDGVLAVLRGRFGSGKSMLAIQMAFDMARKGGGGILLVLEQSVPEVLAQAEHFGWLGQCQKSAIIHTEGRDLATGRRSSPWESLRQAIEERKGFLSIEELEVTSLSRIRQWLENRTQIVELQEFPLRFLVLDPLDAVQLTPRDTEGGFSSQLLRNRTQDILGEATSRGFSLWLTTSHTELDPNNYHYSFLPNIGDVVFRLGMLSAGERHHKEQINTRPLRLFEVEKVRTQRFAEGVHPFELESHEGMRIYPAGGAMSDFVTWRNNTPLPDEGEEGSKHLSSGHAGLDLLLGPKPPNIRQRSVTTLMGPTGCAKTELALLYLLSGRENWGDEPNVRSLFIAFRDSWNSIRSILKGPVGKQLGLKSPRDRERVRDKMDLLQLEVGNRSSGWVLHRIRQKFKALGRGQRYQRVVIDNIAYMDLTTPLVSEDRLFVPNLLRLFEIERVTPLFITSLVEGVETEGHLQTQIRDASHNLIVMRRNRYYNHSFIAAQIYKSQTLEHQKQVFAIEVSDEEDYLNKRKEFEIQFESLCEGPEGFEKRSEFADSTQSAVDPIEKEKGKEIANRVEKLVKKASKLIPKILPLRKSKGWTKNYDYYRQRALMADMVHQIYHLLCRDYGLDVWVRPRPDESVKGRWTTGLPSKDPGLKQESSESEEKAETAETLAKFTEESGEHQEGDQGAENQGGDQGEKSQEPCRSDAAKEPGKNPPDEAQLGRNLFKWRRTYAGLMNRLERQPGISIRLHSLDDYDRPMGELKIEQGGTRR